MRPSVILACALPFVAHGASVSYIDCLDFVTKTIESTWCLYSCTSAPTPTISYTTTKFTTTTRALSCASLTTEPGPDKVKRADTGPYTCTATAVRISILPCISCPAATAYKTALVTNLETVTKYKTCTTKSTPTTTKASSTYPTITPAPTSTTTTKRCSYGCGVPFKSVTFYDAVPAAPASNVICVEYCVD